MNQIKEVRQELIIRREIIITIQDLQEIMIIDIEIQIGVEVRIEADIQIGEGAIAEEEIEMTGQEITKIDHDIPMTEIVVEIETGTEVTQIDINNLEKIDIEKEETLKKLSKGTF